MKRPAITAGINNAIATKGFSRMAHSQLLMRPMYSTGQERPEMTDEQTTATNMGGWVIAGILGVIAWVMKTFTTRHLESMDRLTDKVDAMGRDIGEMKGDIRLLTERTERLEREVDGK